MYGSHAALTYSSIGLTREVYASDLTSGGGAAIDVTTNEIQIPSSLRRDSGSMLVPTKVGGDSDA